MNYEIKRAAELLASVRPSAGSISRKIMGVQVLKMSVSLPAPVAFQIGDTVTAEGDLYVLNTLPTCDKESSIEYTYDLTFEGISYELNKVQFLGLAPNNTLNEAADFSIMGTAEVFLKLIVQNMNRAQSGWKLGTYTATDTKNLSFSQQNCRQVLSTLADEYELEYSIGADKTINLGKIGTVSGQTLQYGQGKGLSGITRGNVDQSNVVTRLFPFGSQKNLKGDYRGNSRRLKLPVSAGKDYIERNTAKYGICEASEIFEEVYPHRIGTVTALTPVNGSAYRVRDSALDFDLNAYLLPGLSAKITFNTGQLAGYELEVGRYLHDIREITLVSHTDEKAMQVPSPLLKPAVGDTYVITDITMPAAYIAAAEDLLQTKATEYLTKNAAPRVIYSVEADPLYFESKAIKLKLGDTVKLIDAELALNADVRVIGLEQDLNNPYAVKLDLAEQVVISDFVRDKVKQEKIETAIRINELSDPAAARRNWMDNQELLGMVFDPEDGKYYSDKIKPESIETMMLQVGARSAQFVLSGVLFQPNYEGNPAKMRASAGILDHYAIKDTIQTWNMAAYSSDVVPIAGQYIYARCEKTAKNGSFYLTTAKTKVDEDSNYYHFLIGVLHSVQDGVRGISLTYGQTTINGRFITTGRVQSADKQTYFDLDAGEISGKIKFIAAGGVLKDVSAVDAASLVQAGKIRYIRDWLNKNNSQWPENYWVEIQALSYSGVNIALNRPVSGPVDYPPRIVDGNTASGNYATGGTALQSVTVDLGAVTEIKEVKIWHYHADGRTFYGTKTEVSPDSVNWFTLFDSATEKIYPETAAGRTYKLNARGLGKMALEDMVSLAKLDSTVIEGGYIKTNLINAQAIIVGLPTNSDLQTAVDGIQIGGRNLIPLNSALFNLAGWEGNGGTTALIADSGRSVVQVTTTATGQGVYQRVAVFQNGQKYTLSVELKCITATASVNLSVEGVGGTVFALRAAGGWQKFSVTVTGGTTLNRAIVIYAAAAGSQVFMVRNAMLEEGTKASSWVPSLEETGAESKAGLDLAKAYSLAISGGSRLYTDEDFAGGEGLTGFNGILPYNNSPNFLVKVERLAKPADAPSKSGFALKISTGGSPTSPGFGGFTFRTPSRPSSVFVCRMVAQIPVGKKINWAGNSMGTGHTVEWISDQWGMGRYKEYACLVRCGSAGLFEVGNYFYLSDGPAPTAAAPLVWWLSSATVFDSTAAEIDYKGLIEKAQDAVDSLQLNVSKELSDLAFVRSWKDYLNVSTILPGLIASGTILVGNTKGNNAGMTGVTLSGATSVRFWAGKPYDERDTAPFRVQDNGVVFLEGATVSGTINGTKGKFGPLNFDPTRVYFEEFHRSGYEIIEILTGSLRVEGGRMGSDGAIAGSGCYISSFGVYAHTDSSHGIAVTIDAPPAALALDISGGKIRIQGNVAVTGVQSIRTGPGYVRYMHFISGLFVYISDRPDGPSIPLS